MKQHLFALCLLLPACGLSQSLAAQHRPELPAVSYTAYHRAVCAAEELIADRMYNEALAAYRQLFADYDFVFLKEYKVVTQVALQVGKVDEAFVYLEKGIAGGWTMKSIKKNRFLRKLRDHSAWKGVEKQYPLLRQQHQGRINPAVRDEVKEMLGADQRKALGALIRFGSKGRERYVETRFAPHSEKQMAKLVPLIETYGYPGEKLTGNSFWAAVILSHHNSISQRYVLRDTLYPRLKPKLLNAIGLGQMSPYELAMIDDWYIAVKSNRREKGYGSLTDVLTEAEQVQVDQARQEIGLCTVATVNRLIDMQRLTGINPYLPRISIFSSTKKTITK